MAANAREDPCLSPHKSINVLESELEPFMIFLNTFVLPAAIRNSCIPNLFLLFLFACGLRIQIEVRLELCFGGH